MKKSKCLIGIIIFVIAVSVVYRAYVVPNVLYPVRYDEYVEKYAADYNIDKKLVFAVIKAESGFDKNDRSKTGARGLMQIMPETGIWAADIIGIDDFSLDMLYDEDTNIRIGCWYLRYLLDMYDGKLETSLAAYNAGCGNVNKWLADSKYSSDGETLDNIPYKETDGYVAKTVKYMSVYEKYYKEL